MSLRTKSLPEDDWDFALKEGIGYVVADVFELDSNNSVYILFANPSSKDANVKLLRSAGGADGIIEIYMGKYGTHIIRSSPGTPMKILPKRLNSNIPSGMVVEYDTSGSAFTLNTSDRTRSLIPGGSGNFATGGGSTVGLAGIVSAGYAILIKITNVSDKTAYYDIRIEWWEE